MSIGEYIFAGTVAFVVLIMSTVAAYRWAEMPYDPIPHVHEAPADGHLHPHVHPHTHETTQELRE